MQTIIMSIKPKYWKDIVNLRKIVEYRKRVWVNTSEPTRVIVYATAPMKRVVGEFTTNNIIQGTPKQVWKHTQGMGAISENEFFEYFKNSKQANAIEIKTLKVYNEPDNINSLKMIGVNSAPQSWQYAKSILNLGE